MTNSDPVDVELPEPTTPRYDSIHLGGTTCIIYDPTAHEAWIQSTDCVDLDDQR